MTGPLRRLRTMRGRVAVQTAAAVFVALNLAGAAVLVVAARTTSHQVEGVLRAVAATLDLDPTAPDGGPALCRGARSNDIVALPGVTRVYLEVHGPRGEVCGRPGAPGLAPLRRPAPWRRVLLGTELAEAGPAGRPAMLVLEQPMAAGWSARFGGDLTAFSDVATRLVTTMLVVGVLGAVGAAASGVVVSRRGLAPVAELADAAETIARTEDLSVRIDVREGVDDEIVRLALAFNRMTAALARSRQRQARLVGDAGHELRTPLTSLRANLELLVRSEQTGRPLPAAHRAGLLADLTGQLAELTHLVDEVVQLSRAEIGAGAGTGTGTGTGAVGGVAAGTAGGAAGGAGRAPGRADARFDQVAGRAVERARARADGHLLDAELEPWVVPGADAEALERAVLNLLDNALKFSPPGSAVRVRLAAGTLTVDDEGPGLAAGQRSMAFERFWRSDDARGLPGSGLGLAIVAQAAGAHGGRAELTDPPSGGGLRAVLTLPGHAP